MNVIHHYPPELFRLLVEAVPLLCPGKKDVLLFFQGAGVSEDLLADYRRKVATDRTSVNKYEIVREVLGRLNDKGDAALRERREVLRRVVECDDFSTCWPGDQLKAKGLVAEIQRVVDVKDAFGRMRQERDAELKKWREDERRKLAAQNEYRAALEAAKKDLYALFGEVVPQRRGKRLEGVLNRLFETAGIQVREAFVRVGAGGEGVVEQIDGAIELDGEIYLVEMKWWDKPLGPADVAPHLVSVYNRRGARGLFISCSGYTDAAVTTCREALAQRVVVLCNLREIVHLLEAERELRDVLKEKIRAAVIDKNPFHPICD